MRFPAIIPSPGDHLDLDEIRGRHRRLRDALARLQGNERNAFAPDAAANAS